MLQTLIKNQIIFAVAFLNSVKKNSNMGNNTLTMRVLFVENEESNK